MFSKLVQDKLGNTALIKACQYGRVETARVLLDHGANVDHQNKVIPSSIIYKTVYRVILYHKFGQSALWWASFVGETECVEVLVKYGAQVDLPVRCV